MQYWIVNLRTGVLWEGFAENAEEVYSHIVINKGDITYLARKDKCLSVKEW